jgi:hypothetical protein
MRSANTWFSVHNGMLRQKCTSPSRGAFGRRLWPCCWRISSGSRDGQAVCGRHGCNGTGNTVLISWLTIAEPCWTMLLAEVSSSAHGAPWWFPGAPPHAPCAPLAYPRTFETEVNRFICNIEGKRSLGGCQTRLGPKKPYGRALRRDLMNSRVLPGEGDL